MLLIFLDAVRILRCGEDLAEDGRQLSDLDREAIPAGDSRTVDRIQTHVWALSTDAERPIG